MNYKKFLPLLIVLTLWINYSNYFALDQKKTKRKIAILQERIARENHLTDVYSNETLLHELKQSYHYDELMYPAVLDHSKAMGEIQEMLHTASSKQCRIDDIKWGQGNSSNTWYEPLRMNVRMYCSPNGFVHFNNTLDKSRKIHIFENFKVVRIDKNKNLMFTFQFIAYQLKAAHEH